MYCECRTVASGGENRTEDRTEALVTMPDSLAPASVIRVLCCGEKFKTACQQPAVVSEKCVDRFSDTPSKRLPLRMLASGMI